MNIHAMRIAIASSFVCLSTIATPAQAGTVFGAASISTNMGTSQNGTSINNVINQSGLSPTYTSGVTNFATYVASALESHGDVSDVWQSNGYTTGNIVFSLGTPTTIESFALWNGYSTHGVQGFTLLASNTSSFTNATNLGNFTATAGGSSAELAQVFDFAATTASYVEMEITSNYTGTFTEVDEAAFQAVPEPSSLLMMLAGFGAIVTVGLRRQRRRVLAFA